MELKSAAMDRCRACAPCGDGASFSCAHGRTDRALLALLDTIAMVSIFDAALANNTIAIILAAPLTRQMAAEHNISPKRVASLLDIFACVVQGIIPHGGQILLAVTLTGLSPFDLIIHNYYVYILAIVTIITIQFGLMKTREEKEGIPLYDENMEPVAKKGNL